MPLCFLLEIDDDSSDIETDNEDTRNSSIIIESSTTSGYESDVDSKKLNRTKIIKGLLGKQPHVNGNNKSNKHSTSLEVNTDSSGCDSGFDSDRVVREKKSNIVHKKSSLMHKKDIIYEVNPNESEDETFESSKRNFYEQSLETNTTKGHTSSFDEGEYFFSYSIQQGLKLSQRCVTALTNQFKESIRNIYTDFYDAFKETNELHTLLKKQPKIYKRGILSIDSSHSAICKVKNDTDGIESILISGRSKCGIAFTDDDVVVRILNNERQKHKKRTQTTLTVYGEVIGVLERRRKQYIEHPVYVCELDSFDNNQVKPICKTIPKIQLIKQIRKSNIFSVDIYKYDSKTQDLVYHDTMPITPSRRRKYLFYVVFISWTTIYPVGVIIHIHKPTKNPLQSGKDIFDLQFEVPTTYKRQTVELTKNKLEIDFETLKKNREDFTKWNNIFTVDPKGTVVLDDAISIDRLHKEDYRYRVGVHITDVTAYISPGDAIDKEAYDRGTTFYAGKFSMPHYMLPEPLSIETCSLSPGNTRLTITVFLYFDKQMKFRGHRILKSFMKSSAQMTYEQVQKIINGNSKSLYKTDIEILLRIATELRQKRLKDASRAVKYEHEITKGMETETNCFEAYYLIEEFMILANDAVANTLMQAPYIRQCLPLRCHDAPATKNVQEWLSSYQKIVDQIVQLQNKKPLVSREVKLKNFEVIGSRIRYVDISFIQKWKFHELKQLMDDGNYIEASQLICTDEIHPFQALALDEWFRIQEHAEYRCSGNVSKLEGSHFGLNTYPYVHFTAPIRRFLDIVVHRLLNSVLDGKRDIPYTQNDIKRLCQKMTEVSVKAKQYENRCRSLIFANELLKQPLIVYGFVKSFTDQDITFVLPGLRFLSDESTTLSLNHLNVCCQPDFKRDMDKENFAANRDILVLNWERRIYSSLKWRPLPSKPERGYQWADDNEPQRIDPHQRMHVYQLDKWLRFVRTACKDGTLVKCAKQISEKDMTTNTFRYVTTTFFTEFDVNSELEKDETKTYDDSTNRKTKSTKSKKNLTENTEIKDKRENWPIITKQACKFSMTFSHGQVVALQLSANIQKGILTPYLQTLDMTQNVKLCIEHMRDPVLCLEKYSVEKTKHVYESVTEYKGIWLPLVQMESVMGAVQMDTIIINETNVMFEDREGHFYLGSEYCEERNIDLGDTGIRFLDVDIDSIPFEDRRMYYVPKSHYLCIRCPISKKQMESADEKQDMSSKPWKLWRPDEYYIWSTHAKISHVSKSKEKESTRVNFVLRKHATSPPYQLSEKRTKLGCCVEILAKSPIDM